MRVILGKLLQVLGALVCLSALACGLGLASDSYGSLSWEILLLLLGLCLLAWGAWIARGKSQ
jgi:hypothetical protein